jgi:hypothetical protein
MTDDLGFTHRRRKDGAVEILHHGRLASTLRGADATHFLARVPRMTANEAQQSMASLTGQYKHGNEGAAAAHPRNKA